MAVYAGTGSSKMPTPTDVTAAEAVVRFEPRFLPSVDYYARMAACRCVLLDTTLRYDRRNKGVHRTVIADTRGPLTLTVPVAKCDRRPQRWSEVTISTHGSWWNTMLVTLESAYGRTPFFEYYIDDFLPFMNQEYAESSPGIIHTDVALDAILRRILLIDARVVYSPEQCIGGAIVDSRDISLPPALPYWQIRDGRFGFLAGMSVLDLIFNLGPEAALYLRARAAGI